MFSERPCSRAGRKQESVVILHNEHLTIFHAQPSPKQLCKGKPTALFLFKATSCHGLELHPQYRIVAPYLFLKIVPFCAVSLLTVSYVHILPVAPYNHNSVQSCNSSCLRTLPSQLHFICKTRNRGPVQVAKRHIPDEHPRTP